MPKWHFLWHFVENRPPKKCCFGTFYDSRDNRVKWVHIATCIFGSRFSTNICLLTAHRTFLSGKFYTSLVIHSLLNWFSPDQGQSTFCDWLIIVETGDINQTYELFEEAVLILIVFSLILNKGISHIQWWGKFKFFSNSYYILLLEVTWLYSTALFISDSNLPILLMRRCYFLLKLLLFLLVIVVLWFVVEDLFCFVIAGYRKWLSSELWFRLTSLSYIMEHSIVSISNVKWSFDRKYSSSSPEINATTAMLSFIDTVVVLFLLLYSEFESSFFWFNLVGLGIV